MKQHSCTTSLPIDAPRRFRCRSPVPNPAASTKNALLRKVRHIPSVIAASADEVRIRYAGAKLTQAPIAFGPARLWNVCFPVAWVRASGTALGT